MKVTLNLLQATLMLLSALSVLTYGPPLEKTQEGELTVELEGIKKDKGQIVFLLFDQSDGFPREVDKAKAKGIVLNFDETASYTFKNLSYGTYSVAVFQDLDKNLEIDSNLIGMPKEPVGASNMNSMGRPNFEKCSFELKEASQTIRLQFILQ